MSERLQPVEPQEQENSEWQLLSEMPHRDYWVGADYNDMYRGRLQLHVPRFESICRQLNLPPIEITSIPYNPPAEQYPEMVGRGFAAWKKAAFGRARSDNDPNATFDIMPMPDTALVGIRMGEQDGTMPVPLGWRLGVRARKIERDIARAGQNLTTDEEEQLFIDGFNNALWQGIKRVQSHEWHDTRSLTMQSNSSKAAIPLMLASFTGTLTPSIIERIAHIDLSLIQSVGPFIGGVSGTQIVSSEVLRRFLDKNQDGTVDPRFREKLSMFISNAWRDENFHERFVQETHGMSRLTEMAIHGVPYIGVTNEHGIKYAIVRKQQSQPLVRLSK